MTMPPMVVPGQRQARQMARQEIVRQMELGATVAEAQRRCSVPMHRTTVYRLLKRVEREGEQVYAERVRHVTRDEIPGATRKNLEECSWVTG